MLEQQSKEQIKMYNNRLYRPCYNEDENDTFLQLTLYNPNLELTREQKDFAVSEAMKQSNTTLEYKKQRNHHIGGKFDIRYQILMNPNWSIEEKANLVYDFYGNDELWDETLEQWEWAIINDSMNYKNSSISCLDKIELYDYKYEELAKFYQDSKITPFPYDIFFNQKVPSFVNKT